MPRYGCAPSDCFSFLAGAIRLVAVLTESDVDNSHPDWWLSLRLWRINSMRTSNKKNERPYEVARFPNYNL